MCGARGQGLRDETPVRDQRSDPAPPLSPLPQQLEQGLEPPRQLEQVRVQVRRRQLEQVRVQARPRQLEQVRVQARPRRPEQVRAQARPRRPEQVRVRVRVQARPRRLERVRVQPPLPERRRSSLARE